MVKHPARIIIAAEYDHRDARKEGVALPRLQRHRGEQVVLAEDDVGPLLSGDFDRIRDAHDTGGIDPQPSKELPEMIAEIAMPSDTQCLQGADSLDTGGYSFGAPSVVTATLEDETAERRAGSSVVA